MRNAFCMLPASLRPEALTSGARGHLPAAMPAEPWLGCDGTVSRPPPHVSLCSPLGPPPCSSPCFDFPPFMCLSEIITHSKRWNKNNVLHCSHWVCNSAVFKYIRCLQSPQRQRPTSPGLFIPNLSGLRLE